MRYQRFFFPISLKYVFTHYETYLWFDELICRNKFISWSTFQGTWRCRFTLYSLNFFIYFLKQCLCICKHAMQDWEHRHLFQQYSLLLLSLNTCQRYFFQGSRSEQEKQLRTTSTLYIGNLSFYTTEEQIYELFSRCGDIRRVIMGLDKYKKTPCGFCFVEYYSRSDAENCMR